MPSEESELRVVRAQQSDLDLIVEIREEAAQWLAGEGIEQWPIGLFVRTSGYIAERIAAGEEHVCYLGDSAVGTLRLQWADPGMWPSVEGDGGFVHGLVIRRVWAGRRIGLQLLHWAEAQVAAVGGLYLRLDCVAHNEPLCHYYERAGFTPAGQIESRWGGGSTLHQRFEKRVAPPR